MFHSAPSMSSIDTNVGSPPIVSRTSPARELGVDARGRARRSRCHCSSVYGLVTRGDSWMRRTRISWSNVDFALVHARR